MNVKNGRQALEHFQTSINSLMKMQEDPAVRGGLAD
jgi:hypothetical protein